MKSRKAKVRHRVAVILSRSVKSGRDRLQGVLRVLGTRPDIDISCYRYDNARENWTINADAVIYVHSLPFCGKIKPGAFTIDLVTPKEHKRKGLHITYDNRAIADAAAKLLLRRGFRSFAYIGTDLQNDVEHSDERGEAFAAIVRSQSYPCAIYRTDPESIEPIDDLGALCRFLADVPKPCGVMIYADDRAQTVYQACRQAHLSIPDQVAIVSVDNETDVCETLHPTLTSILPDFIGSGEDAARLVLRHLDGETLEPCTMSYGVRAVYERDSTVDLRGGGNLAARVDACLRERFKQGETISQLIPSLGASRRLIEKRFREIYGCSVLERLNEYRLTEAKRLLKTTTAPIAEIALSCGFRTNIAFFKAFVAATGLAPSDWRHS